MSSLGFLLPRGVTPGQQSLTHFPHINFKTNNVSDARNLGGLRY